jgi:RNA-directed DNA polymerase
MKRLGNLWESFCSFENLLLAYRKARKGKGSAPALQHFALNLEPELLRLQQQLIEGSYRPGAYRLFTLYERKPRQIAAAPFRDRVVHHAIINQIEPPLDRTFIEDSYACRKGKGVHAAIRSYQQWAKRYPYVLQMDVSRYFPSIDHTTLKQKLAHKIKDRKMLQLLELIVDTSPPFSSEPLHWFEGDDLLTPLERHRGIPIGNLTSQFFANLYLNDLDHFIKQQLRVKGYLRYVDDLTLLADSKQQLHQWQREIEQQLLQIRLQPHPYKSHITPTQVGIDLLGYFITPQKIRLRNDNGHRFSRRLRAFARHYSRGEMQWGDFNPSVQSWIGHARHADTYGLRQTIFQRTVFRRGSGQ